MSPIIDEPNLSVAWARAFLQVANSPGQHSETLIVKVTINPDSCGVENSGIRKTLDAALASAEFSSVETVAGTIFPQSLWNKGQKRAVLFKRYDACWPRIALCKFNKAGTYFRRMTAFPSDSSTKPVNQLDYIIESWNDNVRRNSAFQLAIFDPRTDHKRTPYMGFPCLHQVSITPLGSNGSNGLAVTGYYATQHLFRKAYGNYLGLERLGRFVAHEMGLRLASVTCICTLGKLGELPDENGFLNRFKTQLEDLLNVESQGV